MSLILEESEIRTFAHSGQKEIYVSNSRSNSR